MGRLIVNGDDFGMNERCSRAIAFALREGLITHASMMANGAFFDGAIVLAREHGFFDRIGVHFNLTEGEPLTEAICRIPDFVSDRRFHKQYMKVPRPLSRDEQDAVFQELFAQAERLREAGVGMAHADSHHYVHNLVFLAPIVARVCKATGVARVRLARTFDTREHPRVTENRIDNAWWRGEGFVTTEHFGRLSDVWNAVVPDNTEIMTHPDFDDRGVLVDRTTIINGRPAELKTLIRPLLPTMRQTAFAPESE